MNVMLILLSVFLNCSAQLLMRQGMLAIGQIDKNNLLNSLGGMITSLWLWGAMGCFLGSILLWFVVLSRVEVSYAYMFNSLGYVVVTLGGYFLFHEQVTPLRVLGMFVICVGVIVMAKG